jgi:hypothetical protein
MIVNNAGATLTLSPATVGILDSVSGSTVQMGNPWNNNNDARPAKFPMIDNRGTLNIQGGPTRTSPVDTLNFVADFKSSGTVNVLAGNKLNFFRPLATQASADPAVTDTWGGSWTFSGPITFVGGAIELASGFSSSGNGVLTIGDIEDCQWLQSSYPAGTTALLTTSAPVTFGNRVWLAGCTTVTGAKMTFTNQVTVSDATFRADCEFQSNFSIVDRGSATLDRFRVESTLTLGGYSVFDRTRSMYDDYIGKIGANGRVVVPASAELVVRWMEWTWSDSAAPGNAAIQIDGKATFIKAAYTYDWYVPTSFGAASRSYFTGPTTNKWLANSDVVNFRTSGSVGGFVSIKDYYGPVYANTWTIASTATWEGPSAGGVSWAEFFSSTDVPSSLSIPTNNQRILSLFVYGNSAKVSGPSNGVAYLNNL